MAAKTLEYDPAMVEQRIQQQFFDSADLKYAAAEVLTRPITEAVNALLGCITSGNKVLVCGHGPSAGQARDFAAALLDRFERERPALAAIALMAEGSSTRSADPSEQAERHTALHARQVQALGQPGDLLLVVSTSPDSAQALAAVEAAHDKEMSVVALTGQSAATTPGTAASPAALGGKLAQALVDTDVLIAVPHTRRVRIQEVHLLVLHCLCDAVDLQLLGEIEE